MFDQVVTRPRARWPKTALIVGSAAVHAVGIATLAVVAMWQVDKLPIRELPPLLVQAPRLPAGAEAPRAGTRLDVLRKTMKIKVRDVVQPTAVVTEPAVVPSTGGEPGAGPAGPGDGPACEGPQCADLPPCAEPPSTSLAMRLVMPASTLPGPHSMTWLMPCAAIACTSSIQRIGE